MTEIDDHTINGSRATETKGFFRERALTRVVHVRVALGLCGKPSDGSEMVLKKTEPNRIVLNFGNRPDGFP